MNAAVFHKIVHIELGIRQCIFYAVGTANGHWNASNLQLSKSTRVNEVIKILNNQNVADHFLNKVLFLIIPINVAVVFKTISKLNEANHRCIIPQQGRISPYKLT